ncbi:hypothetical protein ES702_02745 [subsurface metagenome]
MIIQEAGRYKVTGSFSGQDGNNILFHLSLGVNGEQKNNCHIPRKIGAAGDVGSWSLSCSVLVNVGDEISLMAENVVNANDLLVNDGNLMIERLWDN